MAAGGTTAPRYPPRSRNQCGRGPAQALARAPAMKLAGFSILANTRSRTRARAQFRRSTTVTSHHVTPSSNLTPPPAPALRHICAFFVATAPHHPTHVQWLYPQRCQWFHIRHSAGSSDYSSPTHSLFDPLCICQHSRLFECPNLVHERTAMSCIALHRTAPYCTVLLQSDVTSQPTSF